MKKKVALFLVATMCIATVAGCGKAKTEPPKSEPVQETVVEETTTDASVESSTVEEVETPVEETEVVETETTETTEPREYTAEYVYNAVDLKDGVEMSYNQDGVTMTIGVRQENPTLMYFCMDRQLDSAKNQSEFWVVDDDVYVSFGADDNRMVMHHFKDTDGTMKENTEDSTSTGLVTSADDILGVELKETSEYEGTMYDIVTVTTKDDMSETTDADYYFNTTTGDLEYIKANSNGEDVMMTVKRLESFETPAWFAEATDMAETGSMMGEFMMAMFMPMAEEPITEELLNDSLSQSLDLGNIFNFSEGTTTEENSVDGDATVDSDTSVDTEDTTN